MIFDHARRDLGGLAVDDGSRQRSWAELEDRSTRVARHLRDQVGLRPGDHVAILMENRVEYLELLLGGILAGVWVTPINWHLSTQEVAYVIADSGARVLFSDERFGGTAEACATPDCHVLRVGEELDRTLASVSDEPLDPEGPAGANMIYTSGTTGRPKGVKRARPATLAGAFEAQRSYGRSVGLDGAGPHLITGPMHHAAPLMFAVYDQANGAPVLILPAWEERACLSWLRDREVAHTHLVPTMFVRLLRLPDAERAAFRAPALSLVLHGAAPVSVPVKRRMIEWWGPVFAEYWGATEAGVSTLVDTASWLAHPGTVGRAVRGFEVFAVDPQGRRLAAGEVGELYCRQEDVEQPFEYHRDPEKTASCYLGPGVFTIGDIGWVDEHGWVYLADRRSHTIISGGVNIYPAEVEQVLQEHPAVADVAVFGIPDDEWGESVKAAVELRPGHAASPELEAELLDFARAHLARYKVPRSVDFEDRMPRSETGKLYVRELRERYWKARERRI